MANPTNSTRRAVLKYIPVAGLAATMPAHAAASPDADLLALGELFEAAFAREEAERQIARGTGNWEAWDAAYAETGGLVGQIETMPAVTLEGFRVKARCVQWCHGTEPINLAYQDNVDHRLAQQIVNGLLELSDAA